MNSNFEIRRLEAIQRLHDRSLPLQLAGTILPKLPSVFLASEFGVPTVPGFRISSLSITAASLFSLVLTTLLTPTASATPIDRHALVTRHNVTLTNADALTPLSVGNGEFAFTADLTGLQTFPEFHEQGMLLSTMSQWGWHSFPNPQHFQSEDALSNYDAHGRAVPYLDGEGTLHNRTDPQRAKAATAWLRANPHRLDLARVGLLLRAADSSPAQITNLVNPRQTLDLWSGRLESRFTFDGQPVRVLTVCDPEEDLIAVRVESPLLTNGQARVRLAFPYAAGDWTRAADWQHPERHRTQLTTTGARSDFARTLDADKYFAALESSPGSRLERVSEHEFVLASAPATASLEFVLAFAPERLVKPLPTFGATEASAAAHWQKFWQTGGAVDLSGSADPRWRELERRIVLSQYLTAINCAGSLPPQETGLVQNSWFGKPHLEMHWWHAAHFPLWGREALLERSLGWYRKILPAAQATARLQGYAGARWPKMTGPDGRSSPSPIGEFLIWQQPHPIFYAELMRRAKPGRATLEQFQEIVFQTADFMASYAVWDEAGKRFVLGPPIIPAQESYGPERAVIFNPTFELAYWRWALETAQHWREELGLPRNAKWDQVARGLARPTVRDGVYTAIETPPFTVTHDHPSMVAALGFLPPTPLVDEATMRRTLEGIFKTWDWPSTWGWDYPMLAMTAARVGQPDKALDALLIDTPKNRYLANGHNYQRENLPLYLPGNGGLLYATAMMAAGWDGASPHNAPGFPTNGWAVKWEGLRPTP